MWFKDEKNKLVSISWPIMLDTTTLRLNSNNIQFMIEEYKKSPFECGQSFNPASYR